MAEPAELPRAILASVPGTMRHLAERTGVHGDVLWETVRAMRKAGFLARGAGRVFEVGKKIMPDGWCLPPDQLAAARTKGGGGSKKRATILASVPGFPPQDPGRQMVFNVLTSQREADAEIKRLMTSVPGVDWSVARLTAAERRRIRDKPVPANGTDGARQADVGVIRGDDATTRQKNI